jgi:tetratricopeptide (TPR) repeat protein
MSVPLWLGVVSSWPAAAQEPQDEAKEVDALTSKFAIDDNDPVKSVPSPDEAMKQPLQMGYHIMLLSERADAASQRGDHFGAAKYWSAMAKAVPDRSLPFSKMCRAYEAAGDYKSAIESCRTALGKAGVTVEDGLQYARLVLDHKPGTLSAGDIGDIEAIGAHLKTQIQKDAGDVVAARLLCDLGIRVSDVARMQACTKELTRVAPNDPQTLVYSWSLALLQGNLTNAQQTLRLAQQAKLPASTIQRMSEYLKLEQQRRGPWWKRALGDMRLRFGLAAALVVAVVAAMLVINRRRQRWHRA